MKVGDFLLKNRNEDFIGEILKSFLLQASLWVSTYINGRSLLFMAAWIDHKDLFTINQNVDERIVKSNEWGMLPIITEHGDKIAVLCHYIDC